MTIFADKAGAVDGTFGSYGRHWATHSISADPQEISFFTYRLDVLSRWPRTDRRDALIAATLDRLCALGMDRD